MRKIIQLIKYKCNINFLAGLAPCLSVPMRSDSIQRGETIHCVLLQGHFYHTHNCLVSSNSHIGRKGIIPSNTNTVISISGNQIEAISGNQIEAISQLIMTCTDRIRLAMIPMMFQKAIP